MDNDDLETQAQQRNEIEMTEMSKIEAILGRPVLIEEFLKMAIVTVKGLTPDQKDFLRREKKRLKDLHEMDMAEWKDYPEARKIKEDQVMKIVSEILGRPVPIEEFVRMIVPRQPGVMADKKAILEPLQEEMRILNGWDLECWAANPEARAKKENQIMKDVNGSLADNLSGIEFIANNLKNNKDVKKGESDKLKNLQEEMVL
jgi:hypothetical protein